MVVVLVGLLGLVIDLDLVTIVHGHPGFARLNRNADKDTRVVVVIAHLVDHANIAIPQLAARPIQQTHGGMGLLYWTGGQLGDCVIRVVYKMRDHNDNSGVFIRIPIEPREAWMPVHYGYEVQIDNEPEKSNEDDYHVTGALYSLTKPLARPGKPGPEWNTMEITLDGPHTVVFLNGVKVTDYTEGDPVPPKKFNFEPERGPRPNDGYIGLQNHSDKDVVFFKEVAVKMLKK